MFLTHEIWKSQAACEAHMKQSYVIELFRRADELFDGPVEIKLWERIIGN
jgi:quinol monooxygenase YgiN